MVHPLDYFDQLRTSNVPFETQEGSSVVLVNETMRLCQLTSLYPITFYHPQLNRTKIIGGGLVREASILIAMKHFNDRNPVVVPGLDERLKDCNVYLTADFRDSQFSSIEASGQLLQAINVKHSLSSPAPMSLIGAIRPATTLSLAVLTGVNEIPHVASDSISLQLENRDIYPYFARTIPTSSGYAKSLVLHLSSLEVTHFGVLYVRDSYGIDFHTELFREAEARDMNVVGAAYEDSDLTSVDLAAERLKKSELRYFVGIFNPENHRTVLDRIYTQGIIGKPEFVWMFAPFLSVATQSAYLLNAETESNIASAINGAGVVTIQHIPNKHLDQAVGEVFTDQEMLEYFISRHVRIQYCDHGGSCTSCAAY